MDADIWTCIRIYGYIDTLVNGYLDIWVFGNVDIYIYIYIYIYMHELIPALCSCVAAACGASEVSEK